MIQQTNKQKKAAHTRNLYPMFKISLHFNGKEVAGQIEKEHSQLTIQ